MNSCKCSAVTNLNRTGAWAIPEWKLINEFSSEEVATAKTTWAEIGVNVFDMTVVYICSVCAQHWGESPAGHGWSSYRRISSEYSFEKSKK